MTGKRIPLFPLEVVLFPGVPLPLHIFEPRYKLMVRQSMEHSQQFGVVLSKRESIAKVGCTAEIIELVKEYPDGRMDILTMGERPFRIVEVFSEKPYREADVEFLPDADEEPEDEDAELLRTYERCHELIYGQAPEAEERDESTALSYQIAADLPLELDRKQSLLELRGERERRSQLLAHLRELLPSLSQRSRMREKARGNGHGVV